MKQKFLTIILILFCLSLTSFAWADCERIAQIIRDDGREGLLIFCEGDDVDEMPVELTEKDPTQARAPIDAQADDKYQADSKDPAQRPHESKYQADIQQKPVRAPALMKEKL